MNTPWDLIVIGGGAAGFFGALRAAELRPDWRIAILERGKEVLGKVKISGGGRCNLTHACFDPGELAAYYPRGQKELLGPFHRFGPGDTLDWFEKQGVEAKVEADGRMFPVTDRSQSIMDALMHTADARGIQVKKQMGVDKLLPPSVENPHWTLSVRKGDNFLARWVLIASGSNPKVWQQLADLGHRIVPPVPSLFTFNIKSPILKDLMGRSVPHAQVKIVGTHWEAEGPMLITHWGLSGPGILKLSAWAARDLHERTYEFIIEINWLGSAWDMEKGEAWISTQRQQFARKTLSSTRPEGLPQILWDRLLQAAGIQQGRRWADLRKQEATALIDVLFACRLSVKGKSTFKEEFVTAGGVELSEINMRRFESRLHPGLFLAGEVLNIDALTGGFNFQAAWTGSWLAGTAMAE